MSLGNVLEVSDTVAILRWGSGTIISLIMSAWVLPRGQAGLMQMLRQAQVSSAVLGAPPYKPTRVHSPQIPDMSEFHIRNRSNRHTCLG